MTLISDMNNTATPTPCHLEDWEHHLGWATNKYIDIYKTNHSHGKQIQETSIGPDYNSLGTLIENANSIFTEKKKPINRLRGHAIVAPVAVPTGANANVDQPAGAEQRPSKRQKFYGPS